MQRRPGKGSAHSMPMEAQGWLILTQVVSPASQLMSRGRSFCVIRAKVATPLVLPSVCSALHRLQKLHGQECFVKERQSTPSLP